MDDLMTVPEVSERLRRPQGTLRQWRHRGIGPRSFRLGGKVMYLRADVEAWLSQQMMLSASGGAA
jgi:hypothetical protein